MQEAIHSLAAQCLGTQVAVLVPGGDRSGPTEAAAETAAFGRRGWLRTANSQARALAGWRNVKVSSTFSKGRYVPVGRSQRPTEAAAEKWGAGAQFAGGKRSAPTEPAGETDAPAALVAFRKRRRVEKASSGRLFAGVSASAPVGPGRVPLARRTPRRGALMPGGHRSAPTEPAGETPDGIFDATRTSASQPKTRPKRPPPFGGSDGGVSKQGAPAPGPRPMRCAPCGRCPAFLFPAAPV